LLKSIIFTQIMKDYTSISTILLRGIMVIVVIAAFTYLFYKISHYLNIEAPIWIVFFLSLTVLTFGGIIQ
jgi:hypothetical protein